MLPRFHGEPDLARERISLAGQEAHHLIHVYRAKPGDRVVVFDGRGTEYLAEIKSVQRTTATLQVVEAHWKSRESPARLTLGVTLPKADRQRVLVEKCVELGVLRLVPLRSEHSVVERDAAGIDKLRRYVIEASKQCGRNQLMTLEDTMCSKSFFEAPPSNVLRLLADVHGGKPISEIRPSLNSGEEVEGWAAIGPEGGWHESERQFALAQGWEPCSLGARILRTETAALAIAAWWSLASPGDRG